MIPAFSAHTSFHPQPPNAKSFSPSLEADAHFQLGRTPIHPLSPTQLTHALPTIAPFLNAPSTSQAPPPCSSFLLPAQQVASACPQNVSVPGSPDALLADSFLKSSPARNCNNTTSPPAATTTENNNTTNSNSNYNYNDSNSSCIAPPLPHLPPSTSPPQALSGAAANTSPHPLQLPPHLASLVASNPLASQAWQQLTQRQFVQAPSQQQQQHVPLLHPSHPSPPRTLAHVPPSVNANTNQSHSAPLLPLQSAPEPSSLPQPSARVPLQAPPAQQQQEGGPLKAEAEEGEKRGVHTTSAMCIAHDN